VVADAGGTLRLKLGPANERSFRLRHFDGHVFVYHPHEETPHLPVAATFAVGSDNRAISLTISTTTARESWSAREVKH
jgi:hypothetical protein